jgi:hypothetical protein
MNSRLDLLNPSERNLEFNEEFLVLFIDLDVGVLEIDSDIDKLGGFFIRLIGEESLVTIDEAVVFAVMFLDELLFRVLVLSIRDRTLVFGFIFIWIMLNGNMRIDKDLGLMI